MLFNHLTSNKLNSGEIIFYMKGGLQKFETFAQVYFVFLKRYLHTVEVKLPFHGEHGWRLFILAICFGYSFYGKTTLDPR